MHGGDDRRGMRKPLVIFTPKGMLRLPRASSALADLTTGGFCEIIGDTALTEATRVKRVILTTGKIHYELAEAREKQGINNIALIRLEQLYPFPTAELQDVLARYPVTAEVCFVQEEPRNMGAWRFVREQVQPLLDPSRRALRYIGRDESASPAPGSLKRHNFEQADLVEEAMDASSKPQPRTRLVARKKG
jgi:2-oxoglutarate dehydrogenase E1 component